MSEIKLPYQYGKINGKRYYIVEARKIFVNIKPGFTYLLKVEDDQDGAEVEVIQFLSHQHLLTAVYPRVADIEADWRFFAA